jgi:peptidoglycan/LPS O-acetylase OafA/YrhL
LTQDTRQYYRADVDGLRAVAVLAVVAYHAFPAAAPGGFVGVDTFFVISGFLITRIIVTEMAAGTFTMRKFYGRRIRRIFPALIVVLAATLALGWAVLSSDEYRMVGTHVAAGGAFVSNIKLWREAGYFDTAAAAKPLLHLWSLGIEEQFYLIWPPVLLFAWRFGRRVPHVTAIILAASFLLNIATIGYSQPAAFYAPLTRFWELMTGAMVALLTLNGSGWSGRVPSWVPTAAAGLGAVLLVAAIAFVNARTRFPGWWAVPPVVGTALLIAAGPSTWLSRKLLSHPWVVAIGLISYPLYLWHWPLLSLTTIVRGEASPGYRLAATAAAFAFAAVTYHAIERPVRFSRATFAPALLLAVMSVTIAAGLAVRRGIVASASYPGDLYIAQAKEDWAYPDPNGEAAGIPLRLVGSGRERVLFIGDSHVEQYFPRIEKLVREHPLGRSAAFATSGGCPALPGVEMPSKRCPPVMARLTELAGAVGARRVLIGSSWHRYFSPEEDYSVADEGVTSLRLNTPEGRARAFQSLEQELRTLRTRGIGVFLLLAEPHGPEFSPATMLQRSPFGVLAIRHGDLSRPAFEREYVAVDAALAAVGQRASATVINPLDFLCTRDVCPSTQDGVTPVYKDESHLRASYVRQYVTYLDPLLLAP